jgi:hypothetical protein
VIMKLLIKEKFFKVPHNLVFNVTHIIRLRNPVPFHVNVVN